MIKFFLLVAVCFTPLFASPSVEDSQIFEKLENIFDQDLAADLEEAGLTLEEAGEILKLVLSVQNSDVPVAKSDVPRTPVFDAELPKEWECFFETESKRPLIISPKNEDSVYHFLQVAVTV